MKLPKKPAAFMFQIFPIKSLGPVVTTSVTVTPEGFLYDRLFALFDLNGNIVTQRRHPHMALIKQSIQNGTLHVSAPKQENLEIGLLAVRYGEFSSKSFFGREGGVLDQGDCPAEWFTRAIGIKCRLVRQHPEPGFMRARRTTIPGTKTDMEITLPIGLKDSDVVTALGTGSLDQLTRFHAAQRDLSPRSITLARFRMGVAIDYYGPHAEDECSAFELSGVRFIRTRRTERCVMTDIDPHRGRIDKGRPLEMLQRYRLKFPALGEARPRPTFGSSFYPEVDRPTEIRIGPVKFI